MVCPHSLGWCCIRSPAYETWVRRRGELCSGVERPPEGAAQVAWGQLVAQPPGCRLPVWKKPRRFPAHEGASFGLPVWVPGKQLRKFQRRLIVRRTEAPLCRLGRNLWGECGMEGEDQEKAVSIPHTLLTSGRPHPSFKAKWLY